MANELYRVDNGYGFGGSNGTISASNVLTITASTFSMSVDTVDLGSNANVKITGGSNGQALTTDGNGNLSWTTVGGGGASNVIYQTFNGSNAAVFTSGANIGSSDFLESGITLTSALTSNQYSPVYATLATDVADYTVVTLRGGNVSIDASNNYGGTGYLFLDASNTIFFTSPNVYLGTVANITIDGGNSGEVLSTDGAGNLSWISAGGSSDNISNGNSNVSIAAADGNVTVYVDSQLAATFVYSNSMAGMTVPTIVAEDLLFANPGSNVDVSAASNVNLGDVANVHISGGTSGQVLSTDGAGALSWVTGGGGGASDVIYSANPNVANANIYAITESGTSSNLNYYSFAVSFRNEANAVDYGIISAYAGQDTEGGPYNTSVSTSSKSLQFYGENQISINTDYMGNANSYVQFNTGSIVFPPASNISMGSANAGEVLGYNPSTGKLRWTPPVRNDSTVSSASVTIDCDSTDQYNITALAEAVTVNSPTGSPVNGQKLMIRIKDDGTARAITWSSGSGGFRAVGPTLPTTTTLGKVMYVGTIWNSTESYWDVIALSEQA